MKPTRKVVMLLRVSTKGQAKDDRGGLPRQLEVCEQTVRMLQLTCIETVTLRGVSGTEVRGNREIKRILAMIDNREIDGVVVADLDRLVRPAAGEDFAILDPFIDAKATIFANGQGFDFSNPVSILMVRLLISFAEFERMLIANRSRGAVRELCRSGRHPFGPRLLPRGITYDREKNVWSLSEEIAPVLEAYRLMDEGGVTNIAEVARRVGIHERALHNLIRNRLYSGWRVYDTGRAAKKVVSRSGRAYKPKVPLPPEEVIKVQVLNPPPVSQARFDRVQALLAASTKAWKVERADRPDYNLLRSVARCAHCDSRLYFSQDRRRPKSGGYYFCAKNYYRKGKPGTCGVANQSKGSLDEATLGFISEYLRSPEAIRATVLHSEAVAEANHAQPELQATDPATFENRRKRLTDGYESGVISVVDLRERLAKIQVEEDATRRVAANQAKALADPEIERIIRAVVKGSRAFRKYTDPSWQLRTIQRLFSAIYYQDGQIVKCKLQPSLLTPGVCEEILPAPAAAALAMRSGVAPRRRRSANTSTRFPAPCSTVSTSTLRCPR
jgi:DNA invertase Pin-like site-specific DNA recombinase